MTMADQRRRLVWHGVLLFFLSLVEGMFVYSMRNPRMGLTVHVGGITTALFFLGIAVPWEDLRLSPRMATVTYWLTLVGGYGGTAGLLVAALLGTSSATPIAGAGYAAPAWQEALVTAMLSGFGVPMFAACVLLLFGFRGRA
jgi:hydroxylaminobenzene mutase